MEVTYTIAPISTLLFCTAAVPALSPAFISIRRIGKKPALYEVPMSAERGPLLPKDEICAADWRHRRFNK